MRTESNLLSTLLFASLSLLLTSPVVLSNPWQATAPVAPIITLDTDTHLLNTFAAVHESSDLLVTASHDKTIREWDLVGGQLLHTYRIPIGPQHQGRIYALAISPDARVIAVGGNLGFSSGKTQIYLINRETKKLDTIIRDVSGYVVALAWSPDGSSLVAGTSRGVVTRYDAGSAEELQTLHRLKNAISSLQFSRTGSLLITSDDGSVLVMKDDLSDSVRVPFDDEVPGGGAFSPNGNLLAIAVRWRPGVKVFSAQNLSFLYEVDTEGLQGFGFDYVAWSADSQEIWATGRNLNSRRFPVFRWNNSGQGPLKGVTASSERAYSLHYTAERRVILSGQGGGVVAITAPDEESSFGEGTGFFVHSPLFTAFPRPQRLRVSPDGSTVRFRFSGPLRHSLRNTSIVELDVKNLNLKVNPTPLVDEKFLQQIYSISEEANTAPPDEQERLNAKARTLITAYHEKYGPPPFAGRIPAPDPPHVKSAIRSSDGFTFSYGSRPLLNGEPLRIIRGDEARVAAILPDHRGFILGTSQALQGHDETGRRLWRKPVLGLMNDLNVSSDGRFAVVLFHEGFLSWFDTSTGECLLTFAMATDAESWALFTKEGFYHAAGNGASMLGVHINNGPNELADFRKLEDFDPTLHRPDLIGSRLSPDQTSFNQASAATGYSEEAMRSKYTPALRIVANNGKELEWPDALERILRHELLTNSGEYDVASIDEEQLAAMLEEAREAYRSLESAQESTARFLAEPVAIETHKPSLKLEISVEAIEATTITINSGSTVLRTYSIEPEDSDRIEVELPLNEGNETFELRAENTRRGLIAPIQLVTALPSR